ncbi:hypothetical protein GOBAR_DD16414 [Gossypium barbadense]|nr:hypothetical protein GOBAR_DD16414 [Gossypium barbadense]
MSAVNTCSATRSPVGGLARLSGGVRQAGEFGCRSKPLRSMIREVVAHKCTEQEFHAGVRAEVWTQEDETSRATTDCGRDRCVVRVVVARGHTVSLIQYPMAIERYTKSKGIAGGDGEKCCISITIMTPRASSHRTHVTLDHQPAHPAIPRVPTPQMQAGPDHSP